MSEDALDFKSHCCPCHAFEGKLQKCCEPTYWCEFHVEELHDEFTRNEPLEKRLKIMMQDYKVWSWQHKTLKEVSE